MYEEVKSHPLNPANVNPHSNPALRVITRDVGRFRLCRLVRMNRYIRNAYSAFLGVDSNSANVESLYSIRKRRHLAGCLIDDESRTPLQKIKLAVRSSNAYLTV